MNDSDFYNLLRAGRPHRDRGRAAIELLANTPTPWFAPHTGLADYVTVSAGEATICPDAVEQLTRGAFRLSSGEELILALALHLMFGRPSVDLCGLAESVDATYRQAALTAIAQALRVPPAQP